MVKVSHEIYFSKDPETGEEGDFERTIEFPAKWEICSDCRGKGTTYLGFKSRDQPAFTAEDFDREGQDFLEDYMSGNYDSACQGCGGSGKIKQIDEQACNNNESLKYFLEQHYEMLKGAEDDRKTYLMEMGLRA